MTLPEELRQASRYTALDHHRDLLERAAAALEADQKAATRYRWLRDNEGCKWHIGVWDDSPWGDFNVACGNPDETDAAIDAALSTQGEKT